MSPCETKEKRAAPCSKGFPQPKLRVLECSYCVYPTVTWPSLHRPVGTEAQENVLLWLLLVHLPLTQGSHVSCQHQGNCGGITH